MTLINHTTNKATELSYALWQIEGVHKVLENLNSNKSQLESLFVNINDQKLEFELVTILEKLDWLKGVGEELAERAAFLKRNLRIPTMQLKDLFENLERLKFEVSLFNDMNFKHKKSYIKYLPTLVEEVPSEAIAA